MANKLFILRWRNQWVQFAKYLRLVFNDHAILALIFILGASLVAYQSFWMHLTVSVTYQIILAVIVILTGLIGRVPATFIYEEDALYFMGNEAVLRQLRQLGLYYSLVIRIFTQTIMIGILLPLLWREFSNLPILLGLLVGLSYAITIGSMISIWLKSSRFNCVNKQALVNWERVASLENKRVQRILQVFSWFVDIPGQKPAVRVNKLTTWLIEHWPNISGMSRLYVSTFFRVNDYMQIYITILILGIVFQLMLSGWLLIGLLLVLVYLYLIQVLPMMTSYRQHVFDHIMPISMKHRVHQFQSFILPQLLLLVIVWGIVGYRVNGFEQMGLIQEIILVLWVIALVFLYSDRKAENMFKRR